MSFLKIKNLVKKSCDVVDVFVDRNKGLVGVLSGMLDQCSFAEYLISHFISEKLVKFKQTISI